MDSDLSLSNIDPSKREEVMGQVQAGLKQAQLQQMVESLGDTCTSACIQKPGSSLDRSEEPPAPVSRDTPSPVRSSPVLQSAFGVWLMQELVKIAGYSADVEIAIVSILGRTGIEAKSKSDKMRSVFDTSRFQRLPQDVFGEQFTHISACFDPVLRVIFFELTGIHDTEYLENFLPEDKSEELDIFEILEKREAEWARSVLFLFQISHIILLCHPTASNDITYMRFWRTVEMMRQDVKPAIIEALSTMSPPRLVPRLWAKHGRPCSPRLLCVYDRSPVADEPDKRSNPIRRLESALENQLYSILRSSRIITNNSGNSLFAVPFNKPYAYICRPASCILDSRRNGGDDLDELIAKAIGEDSDKENDTHAPDSFYDFFMMHLEEAFDGGFNDNVSRNVGPAFFELPNLAQFAAVAPVVYNVVMGRDAIHKEALSCLSPEINFSEMRCGKIYPLAIRTYQEGLPPFYTAGEHATRLEHVQTIFTTQARGPAVPKYLQMLTDECTAYWCDGRQACEAVSLRGNNCVNQRHALMVDPAVVNDELPRMNHASKVNFICTCSCGHRQAIREDPFDLQAANYDFFWNTADFTCCRSVPNKHEYPVFQPGGSDHLPVSEQVLENFSGAMDSLSDRPRYNSMSKPRLATGGDNSTTEDSRQTMSADASRGRCQLEESVLRSLELTGDISEPGVRRDKHDSQLSPPDALSHSGEEESEIQGGSIASQNPADVLESFVAESLAPGYDDAEEEKNSKPAERSSGSVPPKEKSSVVEQHGSAVAYLPGPSSLYTHSHGLREQPNFSHGSGYLLPWDASVEVADTEKWKQQVDVLNTAAGPTKKFRSLISKGKQASTVSVKVFVGFEYECPRGHRFMLQTPNKLLKHSGPGGPKEPADILVKSDMPLYSPCSCRTMSVAFYGQLMRLHIVTPKMPIFVTVNPRVQPSASAPNIFTPSGLPAKLPPSEYWVLRLPYGYMADNTTFFLPPKPGQPTTARFLKNSLQRCLNNCVDRYFEVYNLVTKAYVERVRSMQGMG